MPVFMGFESILLNDELHFGVLKEGVSLIHAIGGPKAKDRPGSRQQPGPGQKIKIDLKIQ